MDAAKTVYIVDDDRAARQSLDALLRIEGYDVRPFDNGTIFLSAVTPESRGCVLLDVKMPGMSGPEVQQAMKRQHIGLPVVVITGHGDVPMAVKAMKDGAFDFVEKPYRAARILEGVKKALDHDAGRHHCAADFVSRADVEARIDTLTPREAEVMTGVVRGLMNKQIAGELGISDRTVEIHRSRVMEKMQARTLADLIKMSMLVEQNGR